MAAAACVRVREREWETRTEAPKVTKYFIIFTGIGFSPANKKTTENNVIFNGFYWPPKISCYFTGQLKITKIYIGRPKIVDFLQCLFDCALGLIDQYKMARI
jgi:hypothetical protein